MKKPLHVIYVPGLGDVPANGQRRAVARWKKYGIHSHFVQMRWADGEAWPPKFERLLAYIDNLLQQGNDVAITGSSAGGTAVITAFAARRDQLVGAVLIAGKVNRPHYISPEVLQKNPAFGQANQAAFDALDDLEDHHRVRLLSRYGFDEAVGKADSYIPGAKNRRIPTPTHFLTIAAQVTLGAPSFIRFLKRLQTDEKR